MSLIYSSVIMGAISDGDLSTKIEIVEYSTNPREIVKVGDMIKYYNMRERENKPKKKLFGLSGKGIVYDEYA